MYLCFRIAPQFVGQENIILKDGLGIYDCDKFSAPFSIL